MVTKTPARLLQALGLGLGPAKKAPEVTMVDPRDLLMSIPTISDGLPATEDPGTIAEAEFALGEDDWTQVEFFPAARLAELQAKMRELKSFESVNRVELGWKDLYVRKLERRPVIDGVDAPTRLETVLGIKAGGAPLLMASGRISGRVRGGFHMPLGGNVVLYGTTQDDGIPVLAASVGADPDDTKLVAAFTKLHAAEDLILVDWPGQMILIGVTADGKIEVWRP